jgi:RpiB/LacA/LacB family sugar-phosphate isomerase
MRPLIIIPLAGAGSRFPRDVWHVPKPLILIDDKSIIEWSMSCIDYQGCDVIFVVRQQDINEYAIDAFLKEKFGAKVVTVPELTRGAIETCLAAKEFIRPDQPVIIHCSDVFWRPSFDASNFTCPEDGHILTFKSNSSNYSYSQVENGLVIKVAEKKVISNNASVGIYWFKTGEDFLLAANKAIENYEGGELHIAPAMNYLILAGKKISISEVDSMHVFGTPEEFNFFTKNSLRSFPENKNVVGVCSDHSGYATKEVFKKLAAKFHLKVIDFGTYSTQDMDYSNPVKATCKAILEGKCDFGFGFCRSGQGVNIAANKIPGIRSILCYNAWSTAMGVQHNCGNFFAVSEKHTSEVDLEIILAQVMTNTFQGGRHQNRLMNNES